MERGSLYRGGRRVDLQGHRLGREGNIVRNVSGEWKGRGSSGGLRGQKKKGGLDVRRPESLAEVTAVTWL